MSNSFMTSMEQHLNKLSAHHHESMNWKERSGENYFVLEVNKVFDPYLGESSYNITLDGGNLVQITGCINLFHAEDFKRQRESDNTPSLAYTGDFSVLIGNREVATFKLRSTKSVGDLIERFYQVVGSYQDVLIMATKEAFIKHIANLC